MIEANYNDKERVISILTSSFDANKSVNFIVRQDAKRIARIKALMSYSFDVCYSAGAIYLSPDRNACALVLFPDKKRTTLRSIILDIKLLFSCIGLANSRRVLNRESRIKKIHPSESMYYLWFIGVAPDCQYKGIGTTLLNDLIRDSINKVRSIYLETSTEKNIPWYQKFGFHIYNELDLGYKLSFLKRRFVPAEPSSRDAAETH